MNAEQINTLVELRAQTIADIKFNEMKIEFNKINSTSNKATVFKTFTVGHLQGFRKLVFEAIRDYPSANRHDVTQILSVASGIEQSYTSVGARMSELERSGLIIAVAIKQGRFGKPTTCYKIV